VRATASADDPTGSKMSFTGIVGLKNTEFHDVKTFESYPGQPSLGRVVTGEFFNFRDESLQSSLNVHLASRSLRARGWSSSEYPAHAGVVLRIGPITVENKT
jgi:hypothetical protein